jgi:hypothetical protein
MTPWELAQVKQPAADPLLPLLSVEYLDQLHDAVLHSSVRGGYDVWALPFLLTRSCASSAARSPQAGPSSRPAWI